MVVQNSQIQKLSILRMVVAIGCEPWFSGFGVDIFSC